MVKRRSQSKANKSNNASSQNLTEAQDESEGSPRPGPSNVNPKAKKSTVGIKAKKKKANKPKYGKTNTGKDKKLRKITSYCFKSRPTRLPHANFQFVSNNIIDEIKKWQSSSDLLIPKAPFLRLVKEVVMDIADNNNNDGFRWQTEALAALQDASETFLTDVFSDANLACYHRDRATLNPKDINLVMNLRSRYDVIAEYCCK